jgi:DNA-binding transcriptional regulator GbsR (MarR family)
MVCDAQNANERYHAEISRLKAELKRWKDAREASLACEKITVDAMKSMWHKLEALKRERDAYLKALKEIADEQFGTVDECIEFADRCIRQVGGYL